MKVPRLLTDKLLTRLGVQRSEVLELVPNVQPTAVVLDATALLPPILPPSALAGFYASVAGVFPGIQIQSRSPGGIWVRIVQANASIATTWGFGLLAAPAAGGTPLVANLIAGSPVSIPERLDSGAANLGSQTAFWTGAGTNGSVQLDDLIFVPPGLTLLAETNAAITGVVRFGIVWSEAP